MCVIIIIIIMIMFYAHTLFIIFHSFSPLFNVFKVSENSYVNFLCVFKQKVLLVANNKSRKWIFCALIFVALFLGEKRKAYKSLFNSRWKCNNKFTTLWVRVKKIAYCIFIQPSPRSFHCCCAMSQCPREELLFMQRIPFLSDIIF